MKNINYLMIAVIVIAITQSVAADWLLDKATDGEICEIPQEKSKHTTVWSWAPSYTPQAYAAIQWPFHYGTKHPNPQMKNPNDLANIDQTGIEFKNNCDGTYDLTIHTWAARCKKCKHNKKCKWWVHGNIWIDWNGDGDFKDANEHVINRWGWIKSGFRSHTWHSLPIPPNAVDTTYLRANIAPINRGPHASWWFGDVEDYKITTNCPTVPEFASFTVALAILLTTPAFAYMIAKKKH